MINILFYGNCQPFELLKTLNLCKDSYSTTYISCDTTNISESDFLNYIVNSNIIITQPINDYYKEKCYLGTSFIIKNAKPTTKIILFDSCYFNFYYFDLTYKSIDNILIRTPSDYHYNNMIECFKNNIDANTYIENYVNNPNLKTSEELDVIANGSLHELYTRSLNIQKKYSADNVFIISIHDFVKTNYKDKLLFYSMNHPTKLVCHYISEQIINYLNISNTINYNYDAFFGFKAILYACIQQNVNFDISNHQPSVNTLNDVNSITNLYYSAYTQLDSTKL